MKLVTEAEVTDRLAGMPGYKLPSTVTPGRLASYVEGASSIILTKAGVDEDDVPEEGSQERQVLNDLVIRLAVLTVIGDLFGSNSEMREANRRERNDLLAEAAALADDEDEANAGSDDVFFEQV